MSPLLRALLQRQLSSGLWIINDYVVDGGQSRFSGWHASAYGSDRPFKVSVNDKPPLSLAGASNPQVPGFLGSIARGFELRYPDERPLCFRAEGFSENHDVFLLQNRFPIPSAFHQSRVQGAPHEAGFLLNGSSVYSKLVRLAKRYLGRFQVVLDWGCGCGRVFRYFSNLRSVIATDVDPINIEWCRANIPGPTYHLLGPYGEFPIDNASVDFAYGNSVMTHLAESDQQHWLAELRRVVKPGGIVILTVFGLTHLTRVEWGLDDQSVAAWFSTGFRCGGPNHDIDDAVPAGYYIGSAQTPEYIYRHWTNGFRVEAIHDGLSDANQDAVVLRRV